MAIDVQHVALYYANLLPMFRSMRALGAVLMAAALWKEACLIMKALDAGACGIICPMGNLARKAARFVSHLRYPLQGQRSFSPPRLLRGPGQRRGRGR